MTMRKIAFVLMLGTVMGGGLLRWPSASARQQPAGGAAAITGQSATPLADGRWLVLGGESAAGVSRAAVIVDTRTGVSTPLTMSMTAPRAQHTATLLPDGTVLIVGGRGALGDVVETVELFDPQTGAFVPTAVDGGTPRAGHSATLLSDGRVLVAGGAAVGGGLASDLELWDVSAQHVVAAGRLGRARSAQTATLLGDGRVAFSDGVDADGQHVSQIEIFDPRSGRVVAAAPPDDDGAPARVMASTPADGALDVPVEVRLALRFSRPLRIDTLNASTVTLSGHEGPVEVLVVPAEGGRLLFVTPRASLQNDAAYTLTLAGATDVRGVPIVTSPMTFVTVADHRTTSDAADEEAWAPGANASGWKSNRPDSPWRTLAPLQAPPGVTALAGQVLRLDGKPLPDVTFRLEGRTAHSDRTGRFLLLLEGVRDGEHTLAIDARTANRPTRTYGFYEARIGVRAGRTNVLPFTIWSPLIDTAHQITIPSPTTSETVVTTPTMPGLELHLPAGTVITGEDGKAVRAVTMTPIPLDRTPFPLPEDATFTMFFTIQPGGAYLSTSGPIKGGWLVYPRNGLSQVGKRVRFFNYDPDDKGWFAYGLGTVTATKVLPDATTRIYGFTGASFNDGHEPPPPGPPPGDCCRLGGDPVDLTTGIFTYDMTDLVVPDVMPLVLTRTYDSQDTDPQSARPFGIGMTHPYAVFLHMMDVGAFSEADLIQPDGGRIHYVKQPESGAAWYQTIFAHTSSPTDFYKSRMTFWGGILANGGWQVARKDGTVYVFGHMAPLAAIRDRNGNTIRLTWSTTNTFQSGTGNILRVTSPNGRWIAFSYDPSNRITQAQDNIGRTVSYTYTANGELATVTDPEQHVTSYTYDSNHRMLTVKPPNLQGTQTNLVTNEYTTAADAPTPVGWVKKQTHADGGIYQFAYTVVNGKSTQTDVTNPRGFIRRVTMNSDGYTLSDTRALGQPEQQAAATGRQPGSQFVTSSTDALNRQTSATYDVNGNLLTVTRLAGTQAAVTTTYTYDPVLNRVATITDPLNHTTTLGHNASGAVTSVTDALQHTTTMTYNPAGQGTSVTDPLQHTTQVQYAGPDLVTMTDPLGRITRRFFDGGGRLLTQTDPLGQTTLFAYDQVNRVTQVSDPLGGVMTYGVDAAGRLNRVTDARNQSTTYGYDVSNRLASRTDPLSKTETFAYDLQGNPTQWTDRKGQVTGTSYDALNRVSQHTYADGSTVTYGYDAGNRLTTQADSVSGVTRTYDGLDQLMSETTPEGSVSYTYDAAGRRTTMTVAGQPTVTYAYDDADRLTSITQGGSVVTLTYDDANRRTTLTRPNGVMTTYGYDAANQLTSLTYTLGAATLGTLTYAYDAGGKRTSVSGTWARTGLPPALPSASYDAANRITAWGNQPWSYDANGNLASDGLTSYGWNARNELAGLSGATTASFAYDVLGRRRTRTTSGTTSYLYDGINAAQELVGGSPTATLLTSGIDEVFQRTEGAGTWAVLADALGNTVALVDMSGAVQTQYTYEPFGATSTSGAASANTAQYTGREHDSTGLYYYRARYYDPTVGRFLSEDPIGFDADANFYTYTGNDPVNWSDPEGLRRVQVCRQAIERFHHLLGFFNHTYIRVINDSGPDTTYGILGDRGTTKNQIPRARDNRNKGMDCKDVPGCENQIDKLIRALDRDSVSETCPSCGPNYKAWDPEDLVHFFDGYNSNTYVYNMLEGAGLTPPPVSRAPGYHTAPGNWYP